MTGSGRPLRPKFSPLVSQWNCQTAVIRARKTEENSRRSGYKKTAHRQEEKEEGGGQEGRSCRT